MNLIKDCPLLAFVSAMRFSAFSLMPLAVPFLLPCNRRTQRSDNGFRMSVCWQCGCYSKCGARTRFKKLPRGSITSNRSVRRRSLARICVAHQTSLGGMCRAETATNLLAGVEQDFNICIMARNFLLQSRQEHHCLQALLDGWHSTNNNFDELFRKVEA